MLKHVLDRWVDWYGLDSRMIWPVARDQERALVNKVLKFWAP
jgi:hypothetical protein